MKIILLLAVLWVVPIWSTDEWYAYIPKKKTCTLAANYDGEGSSIEPDLVLKRKGCKIANHTPDKGYLVIDCMKTSSPIIFMYGRGLEACASLGEMFEQSK